MSEALDPNADVVLVGPRRAVEAAGPDSAQATPEVPRDAPDEAADRPAAGGPTLDDTVLVARAARGDPRAFETLVRRHQAQMYRVALRITGRTDDAEDATQNAFVAAWRRLPEFRRDAAFSTWLYRIVSNHALNQVRARRRSDQQSDITSLLDAEQPVTSESGPDTRVQTRALLADLHAALERLPPELRVCWYAREVDGRSYQEVAAIAGVSFDVARGRIFRARQRLATELAAWR